MPVADVSVRPARPEDAERVARVQLSTWTTAYDFLPAEALEVPEAQAAALWLRAVELPPPPRHGCLVPRDGADRVGFAASAPSDDVDAVELTALIVEPRWG